MDLIFCENRNEGTDQHAENPVPKDLPVFSLRTSHQKGAAVFPKDASPSAAGKISVSAMPMITDAITAVTGRSGFFYASAFPAAYLQINAAWVPINAQKESISKFSRNTSHPAFS